DAGGTDSVAAEMAAGCGSDRVGCASRRPGARRAVRMAALPGAPGREESICRGQSSRHSGRAKFSALWTSRLLYDCQRKNPATVAAADSSAVLLQLNGHTVTLNGKPNSSGTISWSKDQRQATKWNHSRLKFWKNCGKDTRAAKKSSLCAPAG